MVPTTTRFLREVAAKYGLGAPTSFEDAAALPTSEFFNLLEDYYLNNGLYWLLEELLLTNQKSNFDNRRALRNPAHAAVEFYAGKLWPGQIDRALPIVTENQQLLDPVKQIFAWSNWGATKQVMARKFSMLGTILIKVNVSTDLTRTYLQVIDPRVIPEYGFRLDERGFLTFLRMDIPQEKTKAGEETTWWTEVWQKVQGVGVTYQLFIHQEGLNELDGPVMTKMTGEPPAPEMADAFLPFDFIPVVFIPFRDIGQHWGLGCYVQSLDKIDEANLLATRLHALIYNTDVTWALKANARDAQGRPLPAPDVQMQGEPQGTVVKVGGLKMVKLPGTSDLAPLVPALDFASLMGVVKDMVNEIERDLPEARYYRIASETGGDLSGRAIELLLGDAVDRAVEARGNGETGMIRALQMALSLGVSYNIFKGSIGNFASGDFELKFKDRPIITPTLKEIFEVVKLAVDSGLSIESAMAITNFDKTVVDEVVAAGERQTVKDQANLAAAVLKAQAANVPPVGQEKTNPNPNPNGGNAQ